MTVTDFEADNPYYNKFCLALNLQKIRNLNRNENHTLLLLEPSSVEPTTSKIMLDKLARSINKISNSKSQVELDENYDFSGCSMDLDN